MTLFAEWHPVTSDCGFIRTPLNEAVQGLLGWHSSIGIEYETVAVSDGLEAALRGLLPLAHSKMRKLFVSTAMGWTGFFQNGIAGSDPFPAMSYLSTILGVQALRVCSSPRDSDLPAHMVEVYAPESEGGAPPLGYRRSLGIHYDGSRWTFVNAGEPFPFEDSEMYASPRIRDRFGPEPLRRFLFELGLPALDETLFTVNAEAPAMILKQVTKTWHTPEFTLEEVRAGEPWRRGGAV